LRQLSRAAYNEQPMSSTPFARRAAAWPHFYWLLMAALCIALAWRPLSGDDDIWAHAAIGRWMIENEQWPRQTLFLWGAPPLPWVYHSWLSQLSFYGLLWAGETSGAIAAITLTCLVVIATFTLLWRAWSAQIGGVSPVMIGAFILAIYCSSLRFHPRPELFSALFLCVLLLHLTRFQRSLALEGVLPLGALFVLWANFHGAVAIGLLLLAATVICEIAQRKFSHSSLRWMWLLIVAVGAICINPYGLKYWQALSPVGGEMFQRIDEWKPFWKEPVLDIKFVAGECVLVWFAFLSWILNAEKRWAHGAWLLIMLLLFISARRHLWLLPITSLAVLAANAQTLSTPFAMRAMGLDADAIPRVARFFSRVAMTAIFGMAIAFAAPPNIFSNGPLSTDVPLKATDFFLKNPLVLRGRVFNDYENSSFLQWRFGGKPPLYIDLLNAYPDQLLLDYLDIVNANARGQQLLETLKIQSVMLRSYADDSSLAKLARYLNRNPRWRCSYRGADGTIWTRRKRK